MNVVSGIRHGLAAAPALGAAVGLLDCIRAALEGGTVLTSRHWLSVVAIYGLIWLLPGLLSGILAGFFSRSGRASFLLSVIGTAAFAYGAYKNIVDLPSFTAPESITFDAILLAAATGLFLLFYFLPVRVPVPRARSWFLLLAGILVVSGAAGLFAPGDEPQEVRVTRAEGDRPNVLVFLVDALRRDHLGLYGYPRDTSPNLDAFAEDALVFDGFRVASTWTKPSTASLLTGLLPTSHGAVEHREVLTREALTLAEVFRAADYRTAAFSDNPFVSPEFGFEQGFDEFDYEAPSVFVNGTLLGKALWTLRLVSMSGDILGDSIVGYRGSKILCRNFLDWKDKEDSSRPWFAYLHAMEPHLPYDPPAPWRGTFSDPAYDGPDLDRPPRYMGFLPFETADAVPDDRHRHLVSRYDEEIRTWDAAFGRLLEALRACGELENTIVIVLADHGEEFYEHEGWTHGHSLHEELLRVPLVISGPGAATGRRAEPLRGVDLFSTVLDLAGITLEDGAPGRSFLSQQVHPSPVVCEVSMGGSRARSVQIGGKKLIVSSRGDRTVVTAFDLEADPFEREPKPRAVWESSHGEVLTAVLRAAAKMALTSRSRKISSQEDEVLRGLGYTR